MIFDVAVIGGGPGGYVAAQKAAEAGLSVVLFEKDELGGTCLNRGCIPTKALLYAGEQLDSMRDCQAFGLAAGEVGYDFAALQGRRREVVEAQRRGVEQLMKRCKVRVVQGLAQIAAAGRVLCEGEIYECTDIIIATGSVPSVPDIPGINTPGVVTSDDVLEGDGVDARRIVIWGGGVIAVEFACIYLSLGCEVTMLVRSRLLSGMDREIGQRLGMSLKRKGANVVLGANVCSVGGEDGALEVRYLDKKGAEQVACGEKFVVATGRAPYTDGLFAQGCECLPEEDRGAIVGDELGRTACEHVHVVGDAKRGGAMLAHVASAQAVNLASYLAGLDAPMDVDTIPSCVYTTPEIACVGFTADKAEEAGYAVHVSKTPTGGNGKCRIENSENGFVKIVSDAETGRILGAQLMCPRATDMIAELAVCVSRGLTLKELGSVIHPHPTFVEMLFETAQV